MSFYFTDQIQQSFNKIFHQCNKDIAWAGKAELDALVKLDEEGQKIPGIGDVYANFGARLFRSSVHLD